ncbi:DUF3737 family protein [Dellaglioa sp. BT-FLS60]
MKFIDQQVLTGERALFNAKEMTITDSVFENGESPLKESRDITLKNDIFKWKYPVWYSENVQIDDSILTESARSGIWYTNHIKINNTVIQAPKTFRRGQDIELNHVQLPNAEETFWNCSQIELNDVVANGNYFAMNSSDITIKNFTLTGNYAFDGAKNIEIHNAKIVTKDAFWNCENVTVYDSEITGEYLGWNSKNVTFINCTIASEQGFCYMEDVTVKGDSKIIHTDLAFEYSTVDIDVTSHLESVKNPISGKIISAGIDELIIDDDSIDEAKTTYQVKSEQV